MFGNTCGEKMRCIISGLLRKIDLYATVLICIWKMYIYLSYFHCGIHEIQSVYVTVVLLWLEKINLVQKKKKKKRKKCFPVIFFFLSFLLNPHVFPNSLVSQLISNQRNKWIMLFLLSFCFGYVTFNRCNWRVEQPFFKVSMSFIMVKLCCLLYVLGVWVVSKLFWQIFLSLHYTKVYPYPFWNLWCCALLLWHG